MHLLGIAGWKNSGKTTLACNLVSELTSRRITVSTIKHAHHDFMIDQPGTDSFRQREAGAVEVLAVSDRRWAIIHENKPPEPPQLKTLVDKLDSVDLVIVEGFKRESFPKIEVRREASAGPHLAPDDAHVIAIASDHPVDVVNLPVFDLIDIQSIADFVCDHFGINKGSDR